MIRVTFENGSERTFDDRAGEGCQRYEVHFLPTGGIGIFHVSEPAGGDGPRSRLVEAYSRWLTVIVE